MKIENIKKISNKYAIIRQVYDDRILIRTENLIHSKKYSSYMFILSNNSCIWTNNVYSVVCGKSQYQETFETRLVEIKREDFNRVRTYENKFENFDFEEKDEIHTFEDLVRIAQEQENQNLVTKFVTKFI